MFVFGTLYSEQETALRNQKLFLHALSMDLGGAEKYVSVFKRCFFVLLSYWVLSV